MSLHPVKLFICGASHNESILHGKGFLKQKTSPVLLSAGNLPAVAVGAYGYHMIMPALDIVVTIDSVRLIGKAQSFHDVCDQFLYLLLA